MTMGMTFKVGDYVRISESLALPELQGRSAVIAERKGSGVYALSWRGELGKLAFVLDIWGLYGITLESNYIQPLEDDPESPFHHGDRVIYHDPQLGANYWNEREMIVLSTTPGVVRAIVPGHAGELHPAMVVMCDPAHLRKMRP